MSEWWNELALDQLDAAQWEALCDGCARCCLHQLEDDETGELYQTRVRCRYLDEHSCSCTEYGRRTELVPQCLQVSPDNAGALYWMPDTCAYRLRARGEALPHWHPLVSGDPESVHRAGISVRGRSISEEFVHPDDLEEHVVRWVEKEN